MKSVTVSAIACLVFALVNIGCESHHEQGVKSSHMTQWTMVAANTEKTTNAAKSVLEDAGLKDVRAESTAVDGKATAKKADGTKISVLVKKKEAGSELSVSVGMMGDPALGADIAKKTKAKAEGM